MFGQAKMEDVEHLREPRIHAMGAQPMLVTVATGDPAQTTGPALSKLFKTYFRVRGAIRAPRRVAPRARWPKPFDAPRAEWEGRFGLPVPEEAMAMLRARGVGVPGVTLEVWEYGDVAELLHVGPYREEQATVAKLHAFIEAQGYRIAGAHEEEYMRGPGMVFRGDPRKYLTVIRYPVAKRG